MKVILLKSVPKLGKSGDVVEVNEGYARNALLPRKLATPATASAVADLTRAKAGKAAGISMQQELLARAIGELKGNSAQYLAKANAQGNLFSQIHPKDISAHLYRAHRLAIDPKCITIPGGSIKSVGEYTIDITDRTVYAQIQFIVAAK